MAAAIAAADLLISPVSGPTHIAAAVDTPAVVIIGGYEKPGTAGYPGNIYLTTDMPCSPCFLNTGCPYDKECLRRITPSRVEEAVKQLWTSLQPIKPFGPSVDPEAISQPASISRNL
jgi:ADP-heptose:LPS heptosyltransferase